jgi:hypothetical protein
MSDSSESAIDEERSIHLWSPLGKASWDAVAPNHLTHARGLDKRRYIESITLYVTEFERERPRSTIESRARAKSLERKASELITTIERLLDEPDDRHFTFRLSRFMSGSVSPTELQRAVRAGVIDAALKKTWELPGDRSLNPLGALRDQLKRLQRAASALSKPPRTPQWKPKKGARDNLLARLHTVWKTGSGLDAAPETRGAFIDFLLAVDATLPGEVRLGMSRKCIRDAAATACKTEPK